MLLSLTDCTPTSRIDNVLVLSRRQPYLHDGQSVYPWQDYKEERDTPLQSMEECISSVNLTADA